MTDRPTPPRERPPAMDPSAGAGAQAGVDTRVEPVEQRLARGLQFADMLGFTNQQDIHENRVMLHALAELLVSKGILRLHELEERKKEVARYFEQQDRRPKVHLVVTQDKYEPQACATVDCETRLHLCRASCCKLWFALSVQDLEERVVRWNYAEPYAIAQGDDGYCVHLERGDGHRCGVYENRPLVCRTYSCRDDKRIWLDFEARIVNPDVARDDWPRSAGGAAETPAAAETPPA